MDGFLLMGGKSSRMGQPKALLPFGDDTFATTIYKKLSEVCNRVHLIGSTLEGIDLPIVPDIYSDKGPLAGIHSALHHSTSEEVCIATCDTPFVSSALFAVLEAAAKPDTIVFPKWKGRIYPLHAVWPVSLLDAVAQRIEKDQLRVMDVVFTQPHLAIDVHENHEVFASNLLLNINTMEEYKQHIGALPAR